MRGPATGVLCRKSEKLRWAQERPILGFESWRQLEAKTNHGGDTVEATLSGDSEVHPKSSKTCDFKGDWLVDVKLLL